jgi:hypothetical protein
MNRRRALSMALIPLAFSLISGQAWGQKKGGGGNKGGKGGGGGGKNGGDKKDKANEIHFSGSIKQILPQGLVVASEDSKNHLIGFGPTSEVMVEGEASKEFLAPGVSVEFAVELNREGKANQEVSRLTIVELSPLNPAGLFPTTIAGGSEKPEAATTRPYLARGRITAYQDEQLTLHMGAKSIVVRVSKGSTLEARVSNWRLAKVGDTVKGSGELPPQANLGLMRVVAKRLMIQTSTTIAPKAVNRNK